MKRNRNAVLIVVLAALALSLLVLLILPAVSVPRESGRRATCMNNMSQLVFALINYESVRGHLPPPYTVDANGNPLHSWRTLLLPYMEMYTLYDNIRLDEPWDSPHNSQFHNVPVLSFRCRSDGQDYRTPYTSYDVVVGENTAFPPFNGEEQPRVSIDDISLSEGTSCTILLVERKTPIHWMDPTPLKIEDLPNEIAWRHNDIAMLGFADRSVQTASHLTDPEVLRQLCNWKNRTIPFSEIRTELDAKNDETDRIWEIRRKRNAAGRLSLVVCGVLAVLLLGYGLWRVFNRPKSRG